uniref:Uncharacterized protein n=1 Tax=Arundo donax TaxID=35708 RepID=A0A0A9BAN3_ARUDO
MINKLNSTRGYIGFGLLPGQNDRFINYCFSNKTRNNNK